MNQKIYESTMSSNCPIKSCYGRRLVCWSELPPELVVAIAKCLETRDDILHLRRVCKTWQISTLLDLLTTKKLNILSPLFPRLLPVVQPETSSLPKMIMPTSVFLLQSTTNPELPPFLLSVEEFIPGTLSIRYPLSHYVPRTSRKLPEDPPKNLNLSRFRVSELGSFFTMNYVDDGSGNYMFYNKKSTREPYQSKVVLFVDPKIEGCPAIDDCAIVEIAEPVGLYVTRLGNGEKVKFTFKGRKLEDIVNFKGRIYAIDRFGKVCSLEYHSSKMMSVAEDSVSAGAGPESRKYLAVSVSGEELYLVYRWWKTRGPAFKVYKLNEEEEQWDYVEGIGDDRILFVSFDGCFFAEAKDFPGWKGNSIVFPGGSFHTYSGPAPDHMIFNTPHFYRQHDVAVFLFESGECFPASSLPGYSDVVKPPPSWLWTDASSSTGGSASGRGGTELNDVHDNEGREEKEEVADDEGKGDVEERDIGGKPGAVVGKEEELEPQSDASNNLEMSTYFVRVDKGLETGQHDIVQQEFKDQNHVDFTPGLQP